MPICFLEEAVISGVCMPDMSQDSKLNPTGKGNIRGESDRRVAFRFSRLQTVLVDSSNVQSFYSRG